MGAYTVPTTALFVAGMAEADLILNKKPPIVKPIIGAFLLGIGLYGVQELNPRLASLFCVLLVINSLMFHGLSVFNAVSGNARPTVKKG